MVDYKYKDLFLKSHIDKQLKITADDGSFTATNPDIHFEDFELTESLCSDSELRFGSCEASMVKFQILNAFIPLAGKWLTVTETLDGNTDVPFQYGRYKVFSDVPTADKEYRDIVAYDAMYDILSADVAAWYNTILPNKDSTVTLKQFRESFVRHFGLTEVLPKIGEGNAGNLVYGLVNDSMTVERTIAPEQISGKDVITAICEINGCFGHIGRDGKFHFIYLPQNIQGIYPANFLYPDHVPAQWDYLPQAETGHLYPQDPKGERMGAGRYKKCQYEDYVVRQINKLRIRKEENDIGAAYPDTEPGDKDNAYVVEDNFLVYGKSTAELQVIAQNIYNKITGIIYRPFNADCVGNPCMEVGDPVRFQTKHEIVESYILVRTLKGIQSLNDNYSSKGQKLRSKNVNSVQKSIIQLKGKTNILVRNIEETRLEMKDIEKGLETEIKVTADGLTADINAEVQRATGEEAKLSNSIKVTADGLQANITKEENRAKGEETKLSNNLSVTASGLEAKITSETTRATGEESKLSNSISLTASQIRTELTNTKDNLQTQITANAGEIDLRVKKNGVIAAFNLSPETTTLKANKIDLDGLVNATQLTTKFAKISTLNAEVANLNSVIATKAAITDLNATNAEITKLYANEATLGNLISTKASIDSLDAVSARVGSLEADHVSVSSLNAVNAKFSNLNASNIKSGTLSADRIDVTSLSIGATQITGTIGLWIPYDFYYTTITYVDGDGASHSQRVLTGVSEKRHAHVVNIDGY